MNNIQTLEVVVAETNAVVPVADTIRAALIRDLGPVQERIPEYLLCVKAPVTNQPEADRAALVCSDIAADIKLVKEHEVLSKITAGLHNLHRKWTGLVGEFVFPMDQARRQIKRNILAWEQAEREKAEAEQRRLQALADEQARKERERLEKQAAKIKTAERREDSSICRRCVAVKRKDHATMNPCKIDADCEEWNDGCTRPGGCRIEAGSLSRASAGSPLAWTRTPPTEPGWYWIRGCVMAARKPTPVEVWRGEFGMRIRQSDGGNTYVDNLPHIEWAGPIPEPQDDAENKEVDRDE